MQVSFIVVALNAGDKLKSLIEDLKKQDYEHEKIEIIFVDGNSNDNTKEVMNTFKNSNHDFNRICVLENPKKILPCGWNIALQESRGDVILRVDAHSSIPTNFIRKNVESMQNGEKIVGGHRISIIDEKSPWQKTLLIAETSLFGSGIASYRRTEQKKYVSTLAHAAYSREIFTKVGGYDERLARTEDNEMHYRMKKAGYKFLLDPEIKSFHHARNTLTKMLKQKFMNGYWIGLTLGISPRSFSVYHLVPLVFVIGIILTSIIALNGHLTLSLLFWGVYCIGAISMALLAIRGQNLFFQYLVLPILFFLLHVCYGIGTLIGLIRLAFWLRKEEIKQFSIPIIKKYMDKSEM